VELKITKSKPKKGEYTPTSLEVNGTDIASVVTGYTLTHDVGGAVTCTVKLIPGSVAAAVGAANVRVDDATAQALTALGYVHKDAVAVAMSAVKAMMERQLTKVLMENADENGRCAAEDLSSAVKDVLAQTTIEVLT